MITVSVVASYRCSHPGCTENRLVERKILLGDGLPEIEIPNGWQVRYGDANMGVAGGYYVFCPQHHGQGYLQWSRRKDADAATP